MPDDIQARIHVGYQARRENRLDDARRAFAEAAKLAEDANDGAMLAEAMKGLGQIERDRGETASSLGHYRQAVALLRAPNEPTLAQPLNLAHTVRHLGDILREDGKSAEACPCYEEALGIYRSHPDTALLDLANTLRGYALLLADTGHEDAAMRAWAEAGAIYAELQVEAGAEESKRQIVAGEKRVAALRGQ